MIPTQISDNPAAVIGLLRAVLILIVAFWPNLLNQTQQEAIVALAVASLGLSAITAKTTVPKSPSSDAPPAAIQEPQPPPTP